MSNTITGTIKKIYPTTQVTEKFKKREFVITDNTNTDHPQHISCQLTQAMCAILDNYNVGDTISVSYNLRGREWTPPQGEVKYFNTIEAWKISSETKTPVSNSELTDLGF